MEVSKKRLTIIVIITAGLGYAAAYFSRPVEVKEVVKYKEAKDVVIVKTKYVYPDGTTKEQEVVKDKSVVQLDSEKVQENKKLGVRLALEQKFTSEGSRSLQLGLQSPPLLKLFSMQLGVAASVNTDKEAYGGVYVQF